MLLLVTSSALLAENYSRSVGGRWDERLEWDPHGVPDGNQIHVTLANNGSNALELGLNNKEYTVNELNVSGNDWTLSNGTLVFDSYTAKLMNQWDKEEKLQKRPNHQISLTQDAPINPMSQASGFYLNDAGFTIVPANSVSPLTVENHSQECALLWEKGKVFQDFQVVYIPKGKGVFQSTHSGLIPINAGDAFLLFPGKWHRYRPDPEVEWTEFWIRFNGDYAKKLMTEFFPSSRRPIIRMGYNEALLQLLITLTRTVHTNLTHCSLVSKAYRF